MDWGQGHDPIKNLRKITLDFLLQNFWIIKFFLRRKIYARMFWSDRVQVGWLNADQARLTWQHGARRCWPVDRRRRSWCWPVRNSWTSPAGSWTWARSASGSHLAATWVRIKDKNHPSQHSWKQDCSNPTEPIQMSVCLKNVFARTDHINIFSA